MLAKSAVSADSIFTRIPFHLFCIDLASLCSWLPFLKNMIFYPGRQAQAILLSDCIPFFKIPSLTHLNNHCLFFFNSHFLRHRLLKVRFFFLIDYLNKFSHTLNKKQLFIRELSSSCPALVHGGACTHTHMSTCTH